MYHIFSSVSPHPSCTSKMTVAFVTSPFTVTIRRPICTSARRRTRTVPVCKGRGFGSGSDAGGSQKKKRRVKQFSNSEPRPPGLSEMPDEATLRAEYESLGITPPASFGKAADISESNSDSGGDVADVDVLPEYGTMPEVVAARMGRRMLVFGGVPISLLFLFFSAYFVLTYKFEIRVIPAVVAYSTLLLIGAAGVGITYGIFSSSWDEDVPGSRLGLSEAKVNLFRAKDAILGLQRREKQDDNFDKINRIAKEQRKQKRDGDKDE